MDLGMLQKNQGWTPCRGTVTPGGVNFKLGHFQKGVSEAAMVKLFRG